MHRYGRRKTGIERRPVSLNKDVVLAQASRVDRCPSILKLSLSVNIQWRRKPSQYVA